MDWIYWLLIGPVLVVALLYVAGFAGAGVAVIRAGSAQRPGRRRLLVWGLGGVIAFAPALLLKAQDHRMAREAEARQAGLAALPRVDITRQRPRRVLFVGVIDELEARIAKAHGLRRFADSEAERLQQAYRRQRSAESCHRRHPPGAVMRGTRIPVCRDVPADSLSEVLGLRETILVVVSGRSVSQRQSRVSVGPMYELRLVGPHRDDLVDYYEQTMIRQPASVLRPFSSGWRLKAGERGRRLDDFVADALEGAA